MAGVINDYWCSAHGDFESRTGKCPYGCSLGMVEIRFKKAPGNLTGRTKNIDKTIAGLASEHGLTNLNNHGGTTGAFIPDAGYTKTQREMQEAMLRGQTYAGEMAQGANAIQQTMQAGHFQADNALNQVAPLLTKPRAIVQASDGNAPLTKASLK